MVIKKLNKSGRVAAKILISLTLVFAFTFLYAFQTAAASSKVFDEFGNNAAKVNVRMNGRAVLEDEAAIINSVTYVPLRRFAELCDAESIEWNSQSKTATVQKGIMIAKISDKKNYIEANGRYFYLSQPVKNINGRLFVPIRALALLFSLDVEWNASSRTVELTSTHTPFIVGKKYYNENDLYWLSRIISAEASGEVLLGKIAVGNVVLNRVRSKSYPNTIYGVIFDRKYGTQFSPVAIGTIYKEPTAESVIAAKICLEGFSLSDSIIYFMNPRIATNNWISKTRPFAFRIGNHDFYK